MEISYTSEIPEDYRKAIDACNSFQELYVALNEFKEFCHDAVESAPRTEREFTEFKEGLMKERNGEYAGDEYANRYGSVMMPSIMLRISMVAAEFMVPWGLAFHRLRTAEVVCKKDGIYYWKENGEENAELA